MAKKAKTGGNIEALLGSILAKLEGLEQENRALRSEVQRLSAITAKQPAAAKQPATAAKRGGKGKQPAAAKKPAAAAKKLPAAPKKPKNLVKNVKRNAFPQKKADVYKALREKGLKNSERLGYFEAKRLLSAIEGKKSRAKGEMSDSLKEVARLLKKESGGARAAQSIVNSAFKEKKLSRRETADYVKRNSGRLEGFDTAFKGLTIGQKKSVLDILEKIALSDSYENSPILDALYNQNKNGKGIDYKRLLADNADILEKAKIDDVHKDAIFAKIGGRKAEEAPQYV